MKSYRSSSTFVTVDLLSHELLPFVQNSFSGLFLAMLSHIWMKVGSKLPYEELQIKFDFRHGWPTFSSVIALCSKFIFRIFLGEIMVADFNLLGPMEDLYCFKQYSQYACHHFFLWMVNALVLDKQILLEQVFMSPVLTRVNFGDLSDFCLSSVNESAWYSYTFW